MDRPDPSLRYRRILLKMSGEALMGRAGHGQDPAALGQLAREVRGVVEMGVQVSMVIGGGNLVRGASVEASGIDRSTGDFMGMLATIMNALAVQSVLEKREGLQTRVMSAIPMNPVCEPYIRRRAIRHMEKGRVVICAGGTGNPYFTTDTAAALRAAELECEALLKATQVDGVYSADPKKDPAARRYDRLTYHRVLADDLKVMDASAIDLARNKKIPILVFNVHEEAALVRVLRGEARHTIITDTVGQEG